MNEPVITKQDNTFIITPDGPLSKPFRKRFLEGYQRKCAKESGAPICRFVLDMSKLTRFSAVTMGSILAFWDQLRPYGILELELKNVQPEVYEILTMTKIPENFPISPIAV